MLHLVSSNQVCRLITIVSACSHFIQSFYHSFQLGCCYMLNLRMKKKKKTMSKKLNNLGKINITSKGKTQDSNIGIFDSWQINNWSRYHKYPLPSTKSYTSEELHVSASPLAYQVPIHSSLHPCAVLWIHWVTCVHFSGAATTLGTGYAIKICRKEAEPNELLTELTKVIQLLWGWWRFPQ